MQTIKMPFFVSFVLLNMYNLKDFVKYVRQVQKYTPSMLLRNENLEVALSRMTMLLLHWNSKVNERCHLRTGRVLLAEFPGERVRKRTMYSVNHLESGKLQYIHVWFLSEISPVMQFLLWRIKLYFPKWDCSASLWSHF